MHPETYDFSNEKIKAVVRIFNLGAELHACTLVIYLCLCMCEIDRVKRNKEMKLKD